MSIGATSKLRLAWFVSLTILLTALMPVLSHWVLPRDAATWTEICTMSGARFVRTDAADAQAGLPGDGPVKAMMERCPYCSLHHATLGLPPPALAVPALLDLSEHRPPLFFVAPRLLFAWAPAQARAPPWRA